MFQQNSITNIEEELTRYPFLQALTSNLMRAKEKKTGNGIVNTMHCKI